VWLGDRGYDWISISRSAAPCRQRGQEENRERDTRAREEPLRGRAGKAPWRPAGQGLDKVLESIGCVKQRFSAVARHDEVTVEKAKTGPNAAAAHFIKHRPQYDEADEGAGACVLCTSHTDWNIEMVLRT